MQVDFLQQKNRELERKLLDTAVGAEDAESKYSRAQARNRELEQELQGVDRAAQQLQSDKNVVVRAADREMGQAKVSGDRPRSVGV